MHCTAEGLLDELHSLVQEELKVVSYKWLARQYQMPSNHAKQVLHQYMQQHGTQAKAIFLVAGHLKGDPTCLVTRLVGANSLTACLEDFAVQPSVHVHSVMPAEHRPVTDPGRLWAEDVLQARHFYQSVLQQQQTADGSADVFARNACSSVKFEVNIATPQGKQQQQQQHSPQAQRHQGMHAAAGRPAGSSLIDGDVEQEAAAAAAAAVPVAGSDAGQPPAKRQKLPAAAACGSFSIDPETGEEVWEEEQPQPPAAAVAAAGHGGVAAGAGAAPQQVGELQQNRAAPAAAAPSAGGVGGKSSAAGGAGKAAAAGAKAGGSKAAGKGAKGAKAGKAGQRNIMSFFGKQ